MIMLLIKLKGSLYIQLVNNSSIRRSLLSKMNGRVYRGIWLLVNPLREVNLWNVRARHNGITEKVLF